MILMIIFLTLFYVLILSKLLSGLQHLQKGTNQNEYFVSIIVSARNEQQNIESCLTALVSQAYPQHKLEMIIIDDRSQDATASIVRKFTEKFPNLFLIQVKDLIPGMTPKKRALDIGIRKAKGEIIFVTDADCIPGPNWIQTMISYFEPEVGLVAGFSPLDRTEKPSVFSKLIRLDSLALAAVATGSFGAGFPLTCNSRNLAYRKTVYQQVGGFTDIGHLTSGDDDLFLHRIRKKTSWQARYAIDKDAIVSSVAPANVRDFFHQRVRHASKGRYYAIGLKLGLIAVYLFNISLLLLLVLSPWQNRLLIAFSFSFILKSLFEFVLIYRAATIFACKDYLKYFPLASILHIPYVVFFGFWGQLGKFSWKGDVFNAKLNPTIEIQGN